MISVERDRSAIKNLHEEEVMQVHVSGASSQLRSNVQQFTVEPSPEWRAAGREVGLAPQMPDFWKLAPITGAGAKLRSNDTFLVGASWLRSQPRNRPLV